MSNAARPAHIVRSGEGEGHRTPFGDVVVWKTGEDDTGGAWSLHERTAPPGARSHGHTHARLEESFYVLEGEFDFVIGDEEFSAAAGTFALVPPTVRHGWSVRGDAPGRMLIVFTPSARRAYFEELDRVVRDSDDAPDPAALLALARQYGFD